MTPALAAPGAVARPLGELRSLNEAEKSVVKNAIESELKDPGAAKYKWYKYNGHTHYCGMVNGKNSYGGYVGFQKFMVDVQKSDGGTITGAHKPMIIQRGDAMSSVMETVCAISARADTEDKEPVPEQE